MFNTMDFYDNPWPMILIIIISFPLIIFVPNHIINSNKAEIECKLYNEKYGTNYTKHDFYWSAETIKEYLGEGRNNTQNININGKIPLSLNN